MGGPELLALSLGLSIAVAAAAWAGGRLVERLSADPRLRDRVWATALILPVLPPLVVGLLLLTPAPVRSLPITSGGLPKTLITAPAEFAAIAPEPSFAFDPAMAAWAVLGLAALLTVARLTALAVRARRLMRIVRQAQAPGAALTAMVETAARELAIRPPLVVVSAATSEALLAHLGRAHLILPLGLTDGAGAVAASAVIAHELAHLKRGDHHALWLEEALLALLAVNPLMPVMHARRAAAREEVCDALALADAAPEARRAYARSLIEALRDRAGPQASGGLPALTFTGAGRNTAMSRLKAVLNPATAAGRGPRLMAFGLAGLIAALAGAGSLAVAAERAAVIPTPAAPATAPALPGEQPSAVVPGAGARTLKPETEVRRARTNTERGGSAAIAATEAARNALSPEQRARYRNPTAREYQALCASRDPGDRGFCAGVMFAQLGSAPANGVCPPAALEQGDEAARRVALGTLVERGMTEIARGPIRAGDTASDVARSALARAYPCDAARAEAFREAATRVLDSVPLTVTAGIDGRPLSVQGDETLRVVLTDENGAVMNTFGTLNPGRRASGPLGPLGMAIAADDFPGAGESTRTYILTGEIRGPGRALRYIAEPVTIRLAPGARRVDLRPTLSFRPA